MDIWCIDRVIEKTWKISGSETLSYIVTQEPTNPWRNFIPVTPIMDQQLDQIVIQGVLRPVRTELLRDLQKAMYEEPKLKWFEIYMASSVLLSNADRLLAQSVTMAKRYGFHVSHAGSYCGNATILMLNRLDISLWMRSSPT